MLLDPQALAATRGQQARRLDETLLARAGDLRGLGRIELGVWSGGKVDQRLRDRPRRHQLRAHVPDVAHVALRAPPHELFHELVELGRAHDARRDRPRQGGLLVRDLGGVVAARELVDPDDRHDDEPPHAGPLTGLLQVAGGGREELRRGLLIGRGPGGDVDDRLDTSQGLVQPLAGDHVDALRARDGYDVVAA